MKKIKKLVDILEIYHYQGSLDFPCDFCESNSYNNLHIKRNRNIEFVICKECINKEFNQDKGE